MKKLIACFLISVIVGSCSKDEASQNQDTDTTDTTKDGWDGSVFSFGDINVKAQWTFDSNSRHGGSSPKRLSSVNRYNIGALNADYQDSIDVGVIALKSPNSGELTSNESLSVVVGNYGYLPVLEDFDISYQIAFEDGEFSTPITETIVINDSLPPVNTMDYTFSNPIDLSQKGTYQIQVSTAITGDMDSENNTHLKVVKSLEYTGVCNVHSLIFNQNNTFKLYTLNEDGVCNYVILGEYALDSDLKLLRLYSPDASQEANLIGNIFDVETDENGEFTGTIDIEGICVQLENGYEESDYAEGLTYIPDETLENYLIEIGKDNVTDNYITEAQANSVSFISIEATDNWEVGSAIGFWNFDERFTNRISNLAGIEAFPNLETINLMGQNIDSINISKNPKLKSFSANFNTFKKLDTNNNPALESLSIDSNEVKPILDFSNNTKIKMLSIPMCSIEGYIGEGGYVDLSNMADLEFLDLYDNRLTALDISNNTKLKEIRINIGNSIPSIDLSNNPLVEIILANNSGLKGDLEVSNLTALKILNIANNEIETIDLSNNTKLEYLELNNNKITGTIDVSNCTNLLEFYALFNDNIACIKVNQTQLDAINGVNVPENFNWQLPISVSLDCN